MQFVTLTNTIRDACQALQFKILEVALTQRLNIEFECHAMPWARAQRLVELGEKDGFVTIRTAQRATYSISTSESVMDLGNALFTYSSHPKRAFLSQVTDIRELKGFRVGAYLGDGWAQTHLVSNGIAVDFTSDMVAVLKMLAAKRVDIVIESQIDTNKMIHTLGLHQNIVMLPKLFNITPYYLMFGKLSTHVSRIPEIDRTLREMKADGSTARIIEAYQSSIDTKN